MWILMLFLLVVSIWIVNFILKVLLMIMGKPATFYSLTTRILWYVVVWLMLAGCVGDYIPKTDVGEPVKPTVTEQKNNLPHESQSIQQVSEHIQSDDRNSVVENGTSVDDEDMEDIVEEIYDSNSFDEDQSPVDNKSEGVIEKTDDSYLIDLDKSSYMFEIDGIIYSITDMTKAYVKREFTNIKDEDSIMVDSDKGLLFMWSNPFMAADAIYFTSETASLYKNIHVGMSQDQIKKILGETVLITEDGVEGWAYDYSGEITDQESNLSYVIMPFYDDNNICNALCLGYMKQETTEATMINIEYIDPFYSEEDAEVYIDETYMLDISAGDIRVLMIPYDNKSHKITVINKNGEKNAIEFTPYDLISWGGSYCAEYHFTFEFGKRDIYKADYSSATDEQLWLYVLLIDGKAVELNNIDAMHWPQLLEAFYRQ